MIRPQPISTLFPYTTLFRSLVVLLFGKGMFNFTSPNDEYLINYLNQIVQDNSLDRKSTRLNSSHVRISYAVFCLKKKSVYDNVRLGRSGVGVLRCIVGVGLF